MNKNYLVLISLLALVGCVNQAKEKLIEIAYLRTEIGLEENLVTDDFLIKRIGHPDTKYVFSEWVKFIKENNNIPDRQKEIDTIKRRIQETKESHGLQFENYDNLDVWVYMPNHKNEAELERFLLPPIKMGFFSRPYFILYNNIVVIPGIYTELKQ